jgi:hypothetical protein
MKTLFLILAFLYPNVQTSCVIVKNNGEEVKLAALVIHQSTTSTSFDQLNFVSNGKKQTLDLKDLKRVNLQEAIDKKKGVTTWKALIIKKNDQKMEVNIDLIKISGTNASGEKMVFMSASIDKILF